MFPPFPPPARPAFEKKNHSPSPNTQITRLTKNHIIINPTVRKRLKPYSFRRAGPAPATPIASRRTQRAIAIRALRNPDRRMPLRVRRVCRRRRRQRGQVRQCREHGGSPEEAFACAVEVGVRAGRVGEVGAEDLDRAGSSLASYYPEYIRREGGEHTPPPLSRTTSTKPPRFPRYSSQLLYSVVRLTPFCSRLYASFHSSTSCSRGGTSNLISSASCLDSSFAESFVPGL